MPRRLAKYELLLQDIAPAHKSMITLQKIVLNWLTTRRILFIEDRHYYLFQKLKKNLKYKTFSIHDVKCAAEKWFPDQDKEFL